MVIVDCLTDNNNRTIADVRNCFTKTKAKIGAPGAVAHMFDHSAIFSFDGDDEDAVLEALMEADVDVTDVESEDGKITVLPRIPSILLSKMRCQMRILTQRLTLMKSPLCHKPKRKSALMIYRCLRNSSKCLTTVMTCKTCITTQCYLNNTVNCRINL